MLTYNLLSELHPLHIAVNDGHVETVSQLLSQGADVNQMTRRGITPLHLASSGSTLEMVKMLVDAGADVNSRDGAKRTPLMIACYVGQEAIGRYLMEKGAKVNARCRFWMTPLMYALFSIPCGASFISDLLRAGAGVNIHDRFDMTPLQAAVRNKRFHLDEDKWDILQLLLTYPCDIDAADISGTTALHIAKQNNDLKAALMLIKAGCKVNIEDRDAMTPVSYAIRHNNHNRLEMFLAAGARVSRVLASCSECPSLSRMCRRSFYDHYGTEARNRIEKLPLPPLIKKYLYFEIL